MQEAAISWALRNNKRQRRVRSRTNTHTHISLYLTVTITHTNVQTMHLLYRLSLCSLSGNESVSCLSITDLLLSIVFFSLYRMCVTVFECGSNTVRGTHTHKHSYSLCFDRKFILPKNFLLFGKEVGKPFPVTEIETMKKKHYKTWHLSSYVITHQRELEKQNISDLFSRGLYVTEKKLWENKKCAKYIFMNTFCEASLKNSEDASHSLIIILAALLSSAFSFMISV